MTVTRYPLASLPIGKAIEPETARYATLVLHDGTAYQGISFGAEQSVAGECVFQTGMIGYPESLTDPSYSGQILVLTFPLVGNYGVPDREALHAELEGLPRYFESRKIHVAALVVGQYTEEFSHYLAQSSLGSWLREQGVPAIHGIDTRALTKKIRNQGVMLGKLLFPHALEAPATQVDATSKWMSAYTDMPWSDPNATNLVAKVSTTKVTTYRAQSTKAVLSRNGKTINILAVDVGMKFNQIRCFTSYGADVTVVPWDFDFTASTIPFDGLFISNGPGDPTVCAPLIARLRVMIERKTVPIFGICLGHQLLALAAGAQTRKMKFGNRGHNIPCTDMITGRCYITSQNHGYAVDTATLPKNWAELFVNANDGSNEGIFHKELPFFSVQFHPESTPGPQDTEFLFERFIGLVEAHSMHGTMKSFATTEGPKCNPVRVSVRKVLVLGSGGLSIGQAGEFDYSGSQAIKALKEEGIYTILINPNIATIQTSQGLADKVFFLPVTPEFVRKVIQYERPDGISVSFGGQTALSVGIALKDEFEALGVRVLGTPIDTVIITEDRELFANSMAEIGEHCATSFSAKNTEEALAAASRIGYPVIARAAFALGGLGSGFASNADELKALCKKSFAYSPQLLVERSMKGWKEIEYEVVRDINDNCITVCNMENFDPLGIHTGDSIVVAPSQTLSDDDYMMLRKTALSVIRHLGVVGECNIQYALNPDSKEYCIIEVNARLSRSSALASKATGYPLAFVAAKLGLGIPLSELKNSVTQVTCACFEPSLDYVVVKMPRWDLKKFNRVSTKVGSAMKSVGEVMAIGRTFEETIQKAIRSIDNSYSGFTKLAGIHVTEEELRNPSDQRLFAIADAMHSGQYDVEKIWELTRIDRWFLNKLMHIVNMDKLLSTHEPHTLSPIVLRQAKELGFTDSQIARNTGTSEIAIRRIRQEMNITPFVKQIDTVAAEYPSVTNYLYMTYNAVEHDVAFHDNGVLVMGSGVYRIGSSVEFDWCAVRAVRTLRDAGYKTIMLNYNPETVSTDYDESDRLYFENISLETAMDVYELEQSSGVIVSVGGQTPNNIALGLHREGVKIYGTSPEQIDGAENRYKFSRMCDAIGVDQPQWRELSNTADARAFCDKVGYPVLVRPSYVLSGAAMNVVFSSEDLENYLNMAAAVSPEQPVVISKFIEGAKEIEMDAVARDGKLIYHVISEHVENAGVHSGDATLVLPPQDLEPETIAKIEEATRKIGNALNVTGPFNIQFIAKDNEIKVIECNVRASRSFPFCSKVMGTDLIEMATKAMMKIPVEPYPPSRVPKSGYVCVKVPQFSFSRLSGADPVLGVEMASTGEVACFGKDLYSAYLKALLSTSFVLPKKNILLSMGSFKEKQEFLPSVWKLHRLGYTIFATTGTADFIAENGIPVKYLEALDGSDKDQKAEYSLTQHLSNNLIDLYINLPSQNRYRRPASYMSKGYITRRMAIDMSIPLITNIKCAKLFVEALSRKDDLPVSEVDYKTSHRVLTLPGLIDVSTFFGVDALTHAQAVTRKCLEGGFTSINAVVADPTSTLTHRDALAALHTKSHCDYVAPVEITLANYRQMDAAAADAGAVLFRFGEASGKLSLVEVAKVFEHVAQLPAKVRVVTDARGTHLASILLVAGLHKAPLHVSGVMTAEDIGLVALNKKTGVDVTCDVSIFNLFLSKKDFPDSNAVGQVEDVAALWENFETIDCLTTGQVLERLARDCGVQAQPGMGVDYAVPLLLSALDDGRLCVDDVRSKLYENPRKIFRFPVDTQTEVEFEVDRKYTFTVSNANEWSPFIGRKMSAKVCRVVVKDETVFIDGTFADCMVPLGVKLAVMERAISNAGSAAVVGASGIVPSNASGAALFKMDAPSAAMLAPRRSRSDVKSLGPHDVTKPSSMLVPMDTIVDGASDSVLPFSKDMVGPLSARQSVELLRDIPSNMRALYYRQHILSVRQFARPELHVLFNAAQEMRTIVERYGTCNVLCGKVMCNLFYEPSTRTSCSFESAMVRLGGQVINVTGTTSSVVKGESLADTVRTIGCYADAIVIRHPESGSARTAAKYSKVPILNAGDGIGEHPTQAFLDVYTVREELGTVNGLTITLVGDLKNGRTVHSLVKLLALYDVKINYVSPESLRMPEEVQQELRQKGIAQVEHSALTEDLIAHTDVLYVTRIQKERFARVEDYEQVKDSYRITNALLKKAKSSMIIMHPLPRVNEIDPEVDFDQRAAYFRQMKYGLYVRMALLALVLAR